MIDLSKRELPMNRGKNIQIDFKDAEKNSVKFTLREAQCAKFIMHGRTLKQTAALLELSKRTVEFYFNNIKIKLGLTKKSDVVGLLFASDFLNKFQD